MRGSAAFSFLVILFARAAGAATVSSVGLAGAASSIMATASSMGLAGATKGSAVSLVTVGGGGCVGSGVCGSSNSPKIFCFQSSYSFFFFGSGAADCPAGFEGIYHKKRKKK